MAEETVLEKKQKLTVRKRLLEKQEAREAKALKKSTPPATIECSSNMSVASAVLSSGAEAGVESLEASKENEPPKLPMLCAALVIIASLGSTSENHLPLLVTPVT
jgi:hypothetical protein